MSTIPVTSGIPGTPAIIDASKLPHAVLDHRSPIWWGNLLLLVIETTMFAILIASYFYIRMNFQPWPPPRVDRMPVIYHPVPGLAMGTANLALLLVSCLPMLWADRACLRMNTDAVKVALTICVVFGVVSAVMRFYEFPALLFRWDDNAYASTIWTIIGLHLMHIIVVTAETALMTLWVFTKGMDDKHARDIRVTATYWYWVAGIWVILYAVVYWAPRLL